MKKFINDVEQVENEMIQGMVKAYPQYLKQLEGHNVVVRAKKKEGKVALISGGGSGHEPAHGGYVGEGMLDCAVAGAVFTSPTPDAIYEGIKAVDSGAGVLMIVKNYTGDVMNFEMAAEMAQMEGIEVKVSTCSWILGNFSRHLGRIIGRKWAARLTEIPIFKIPEVSFLTSRSSFFKLSSIRSCFLPASIRSFPS